MDESNIGIGNKLELTNEELLLNLKEVQERNGFKQSEVLEDSPYFKFEVDMKTGTGETYVFIRIIRELNKEYGFKNFIIVIPSLRIKECIHQSLKSTETHINSLYSNEVYDYFVYNNDHLNQINSFTTVDKYID